MSLVFDYAASLYRTLRAEFDLVTESAYVRAERDTRGQLVNRAGRERGVTARSLFAGDSRHAERYATDELLGHWSRWPRPCFADFERDRLEEHLGGGYR